MLQQATPKVFGETAATAVILARGIPAKTVLALKRLLEELRFRVVVAGTRDAALRACEDGAALLLAPADDGGAGLFWGLRRACAGSAGPCGIAVATDEADAALVLDMLAAGADDCLVWPFNGRLLAQRLEQMAVWA